jgi:protein associated with RNAse G/E
MWKPGDVVCWRGIRNHRVWHVQPTMVVKDSPEELVLTLLPGTECMAEETYPLGKKKGRRWWDFKENDWKLAKYIWRTNRLLLIFEPEKHYSTVLFWHHESHEFLYYYINFQVPFQRNRGNVDALDLDLDLVIKPDLAVEWKDEEDYRRSIDHGAITPDLIQGIESGASEILAKLDKRLYPFDGAWLDWKPDPAWVPPTLPENWDKI